METGRLPEAGRCLKFREVVFADNLSLAIPPDDIGALRLFARESALDLGAILSDLRQSAFWSVPSPRVGFRRASRIKYLPTKRRLIEQYKLAATRDASLTDVSPSITESDDFPCRL